MHAARTRRPEMRVSSAANGRRWDWRNRRDRVTPPESTCIEIPVLAPARGAVPTQGSLDFRRWADTLCHVAADDGIHRIEEEIAELVSIARRDRVAPGCTEIVADRSQPAVARERALGRVVTRLVLLPDTRRCLHDASVVAPSSQPATPDGDATMKDDRQL